MAPRPKPAPPPASPHIEDVLLFAVCMEHRRYVFGVENDAAVLAVLADHPDPTQLDARVDDYLARVPSSDCSELVQSACALAGVTVPDGSWLQYQACERASTVCSVAEAVATRGALLFRFSTDPNSPGRPANAHVAWSLGDGTTVEARSHAMGIGSWPAAGRGWTHAALIPGVGYGPRPAPPGPEPHTPPPAPWPIPVREDPMFTPPLELRPVVASCPAPGGALLLGDDGSVYAFASVVVPRTPDGQPWVIGPNGQPYFAGRTPASIATTSSGGWVVTATSGETYHYPHPPEGVKP